MSPETAPNSPLYVLIPTHGRSTLLARTLASLAECELPESYLETVVVENGPKEGAEAVCAAAAARLKVRYLHVEKANKSHALNEALKTLPEKAFVVYFDDDVRLASEVLVAYAEAAAKHGPGHFFGGPTQVDYETPPPAWIVPYLPGSARGWMPSSLEELYQARFLGCNWAAFASDVQATGGYDVSRGPGTSSVGQEYDMQVRLLEQGVEPVFVEEALVWHYVPEKRCSPEWMLQRVRRIGVSMGKKERREHGFEWARMMLHARRWGRYVLRSRQKQDDEAERFDTAYNRVRHGSILQGYVAG